MLFRSEEGASGPEYDAAKQKVADAEATLAEHERYDQITCQAAEPDADDPFAAHALLPHIQLSGVGFPGVLDKLIISLSGRENKSTSEKWLWNHKKNPQCFLQNGERRCFSDARSKNFTRRKPGEVIKMQQNSFWKAFTVVFCFRTRSL